MVARCKFCDGKMSEIESGVTLDMNPPIYTWSQTCRQCGAEFGGAFSENTEPRYSWVIPAYVLVNHTRDNYISGIYRTLTQAQKAAFYPLSWEKGKEIDGNVCWIAKRGEPPGYVTEYRIYKKHLIDPCDGSGMSITDSK